MKKLLPIVILALSHAASAQPSITSVGLRPTRISGDGRVVVGMTSDNSAGYWTRSSGTVAIGAPAGATSVYSVGASVDGAVILGTARLNNATITWEWTQAGGMNIVSIPGLQYPVARCITRDGTVIGGASSVQPFFNRAFVLGPSGSLTVPPQGENYASAVSALSADARSAAGTTSSAVGTWPAFWESIDGPCQSIGPIPGQSGGAVFGMTPTSDVIVGDLDTQAYVWTVGQGLAFINPPYPGWGPHLRGVSDDGSTAAGYLYDPPSPGHDAGLRSILWRRGAGLVDGPDYFAAHGLQLPFPCGIIAISANGRVFAADMGPILDYFEGYVIELSACGSTDFNHDGDYGTDRDIEAFFACLAGDCCALCDTADFNGDGDSGTDADIEAFFRVLAGGSC